MRKIICFVSALAFMLTGCSSYTLSETPDYEPWNISDIMENDTGIYTNLDYMSHWNMMNDDDVIMHKYEKGEWLYQDTYHMWCHDKKTGYDMMLCSRPECPHDGRDTCTATYRNLFNGAMRMYDNSVWFLAAEENKGTVSVSLYRTAGDGTSLDRVSELFSFKNDQSGEKYWLESSNMIIHRGCAYSSFEITHGVGGYDGFYGGGFVKTDLKTGKSTMIYSYDNYFENKIMQYEVCGDYIIYTKKNNLSHTVFHRLDIRDFTDKEIDVENADNTQLITSDNDNIYLKALAGKTNRTVSAYNPETDTLSDTGIKASEGASLIAYEGKIFCLDVKKKQLTLDVYENGEIIFSINEFPNFNIDNQGCFYRQSICRGKYYFILDSVKNETYWSCSADELISGNVDWTKEFDTDDMEQSYWEYIYR